MPSGRVPLAGGRGLRGAVMAGALTLGACSAWQVPGPEILFDPGTRCYQGYLCILQEESAESLVWTLDFWAPVPYRFVFDLLVEGAEATPPGIRLQLEHPGRYLLTSLRKPDLGRPWRYSWRFTAHPGTTGQHDDSVVYRLPWAPGESFAVLQGYGGYYSHREAGEFALDFAMPEGTPIHAARAGAVYLLRDDSRLRVRGQANYVYIRHDDGSLALYNHLRSGGIVVQPGDRVAAGDLLGYSGNTGHSTTPHLHFQVAEPLASGEAAYRTLPVRFATRSGPVQLETGIPYLNPPADRDE